jgi:hypothetical protein
MKGSWGHCEGWVGGKGGRCAREDSMSGVRCNIFHSWFISLATLTLDFRRLRMTALLALNPAGKAHSYRDAFRPC